MKRIVLLLLGSGLLLLSTMVLVFLYGFQTNTLPYEVKLARNWYVATHSDVTFVGKPVRLDWQVAEIDKKDGMVYIIVPFLDSDNFVYLFGPDASDQSDRSLFNGSTYLVISKRPGDNGYKTNFLQMCASPELVKQYGKAVLKRYRPNRIRDFSGQMLYTGIKDDKIEGRLYENGQVTGFITERINNSSGAAISRGCLQWQLVHQYIEYGGYSAHIGTHAICVVFDDLGPGGTDPTNYNPTLVNSDPYGYGFYPNEPPPPSPGPTGVKCPDGSFQKSSPCMCPDGKEMGSSGECGADPIQCTKTVDPLNTRLFDVSWAGVAAPTEQCLIGGHVQFSQDAHWTETLGVSLISSTAYGGMISAGGGEVSVTFTWTATFISQVVSGSQSRTESRALYFDGTCCKN